MIAPRSRGVRGRGREKTRTTKETGRKRAPALQRTGGLDRSGNGGGEQTMSDLN